MKNRSLVFLLICLVTVTNVPYLYNVSGQQSLNYVILFDESHGQVFNRTLMDTALDSLTNITIEDPDTEIVVKLLFQTESRFNSTNLQGVDLLIFTNPGLEEEDNLEQAEREAILDFTELGGSLFLLCNPLTQQDNITGHPTTMNDLLIEREDWLTSARFMFGVNQSFARVIVDDFNSTYGNETYVTFNEYNSTKIIFNQNTVDFFRQETEIDNVTIYSNSISLGNERLDEDILDKTIQVGKTPITSYAINEDYDIYRDPTNGFLTWLFAKKTGGTRFAMSGSTIMFSDLEIAENTTWIEQNQNLELWNNLILWLLKYTPHPERDPPAVWVFENYALLVFAISAAIFGISVLVFRYRNKRRTTVKIK
ncbi:MAG: hypothetical protein HeimAB125_02260 [Candidatus Heimdallarchaeota archaeon AB_125]|nr:MAG: hypothetical protein HeimAB125_02260 [Candidatus Heimdallarchaeota archaeon AB_125]